MSRARRRPPAHGAPAALVALTAAALAGCGHAPFVAPEVPVPAQWRDAPVTDDALTDRPWAQVFAVPELDALVDEALAGSADLRIAAERVALARAQLGLERSAAFPTVALSASATRQRAPGPGGNVVGEVGSVALVVPAWEIDLWGRLAARTEAARSALAADAALAEAARISLAAQVSSLYLDLLDLDQQIAISERALAGRRQALRLTRARFDEGVAPFLDVRQAESLLAASESALAEQRRRQAQVENALSALLGRMPGPIARSARLDALQAPPEALAGLPSALLLRRPDVAAAEERLRGAQASVDAARKAWWPTLSLTTLLGFASPDLGRLFDGDRRAWSLQPAVDLPLFTGGRIGAGVDAAEAQRRIALEQYRETVRQAFREVADALAAFERLGAQREAGSRIAVANRERLRIVNARYVAGVSSYFEVLDAERQWFDSELALSQTTRALHQSVVQLYRALGGGWSRTGR